MWKVAKAYEISSADGQITMPPKPLTVSGPVNRRDVLKKIHGAAFTTESDRSFVLKLYQKGAPDIFRVCEEAELAFVEKLQDAIRAA